VIVFGANRELLKIYLAKEPEFNLIYSKKGILRLFLAIRAYLSLLSFHSSILNKKLYISMLYPGQLLGVV